jgi:hypothetical protein
MMLVLFKMLMQYEKNICLMMIDYVVDHNNDDDEDYVDDDDGNRIEE